LAENETHTETVSLTLPTTGALTNLVDVFLLFDDTGSFTSNSPIVRAAFPNIISTLTTRLPGIDLGFGVGRLEEYGHFAGEYATGRPFVLNQPIIASSAAGYTDAQVLASIQAALDREAPGYGGDAPETVIEALYQMVTGAGFDGDNNGSSLDSGPAGLASTQVSPGNSGDVPPFASFTPDPVNGVLASSGTIGGAGFRSGALPIIITATDVGFAYQPKGETTLTGIDGFTVPTSNMTFDGRGTTPFGNGAGIQETVTGLNALGALVIGLGTNDSAAVDPRIGLEALANLTGAINRTTNTIANGTTDPIAPGDPLYFMIGSGGGTLVNNIADGIVAAIEGAVTAVSVNVTLRASDPRVKISFNPGVINGLKAGNTATFDVTFTGDGRPHRFDLQFVREGTDVILGSIPVVLGTPIPGDGYEFEDCDDGEHSLSVDFSNQLVGDFTPNVAPSFTAGSDLDVAEDAGLQTISNWATNISPGPSTEAGQQVAFVVSTDNPTLFALQPTIAADGTLTFTPADNAHGIANVTVQLHDDGGTLRGGEDTSPPQGFTITVAPVNDPPVAGDDAYAVNEDALLSISAPGVLGNDLDIDGDDLTVIVADEPAHGTLTLESNGSLTYRPDANFFGIDSFTYRSLDGATVSNLATVMLTVLSVNDIPLTVGDDYTTNAETPLSVAAAGVLSNDSDVDGDALSASVSTPPAHGQLLLHADGSFEYTPDIGFVGIDTFTYRALDGVAESAETIVNIAVSPVNRAPQAMPDVYSTREDETLAVTVNGLLTNDVDANHDPLTVVVVDFPAHGNLTWLLDGSFTYIPALDFNGLDGFTYRASDGRLDSEVTSVTINVTPVNDAPLATNDSYSVLQEASVIVLPADLLANDRDVDGDALSVVLRDSPQHGTLTIESDGSLLYRPAPGYSGSDSFTYVASDGASESNLGTVSIDILPKVIDIEQRFVVVDASRRVYVYGSDGTPLETQLLNQENEGLTGIAVSSDGSKTWIVDRKGEVFVYDQSGKLLGSWKARGIDKPEGITTDGVNLWIVDNERDRVYSFAGAAARLAGSLRPTSSFRLTPSNRNPTDLVTDGTSLWVTNSSAREDRVFRYTLDGTLAGIWSLDPRNSQPTGITIDPSNLLNLWIVDAQADQVFEYVGGAQFTSGNHVADKNLALQKSNGQSQGLAFTVSTSPAPAGLLAPAAGAASAKQDKTSGAAPGTEALAAMLGYLWPQESGSYDSVDRFFTDLEEDEADSVASASTDAFVLARRAPDGMW
jgi:hypothetical protein